MLRKLLTTIALATAITVPMAGSAMAAEPTSLHPAATPHTVGAGSAGTSVVARQIRPNDKSAAALSPNSSCAVTEYGYTGYRVCGYVWSSINRGNGDEYFVVGTDYAIWHIWPGSGGWHSLGGQSNRSTVNGAYTYVDGVETLGTDSRWWCRDWPWTYGWYLC